MLDDSFSDMNVDITEENIQSRIRGVTLMALSNKFGHMLLTTGNKSEMSVGYATIYGDMAGGYSVLKDAYKTTVFALSRWRNENRPPLGLGADGPVMPDRVITKPPSADSLRPMTCSTRRTATACRPMTCSTADPARADRGGAWRQRARQTKPFAIDRRKEFMSANKRLMMPQ